MSAKAVASLCPNQAVIPEVHFTPGLLEKIAQSVIDGYTASLHGGLEVGGVVFGRRDGAQVTAEKFRQLSCDHSMGPRFILSENDERGLRDLLEAPRLDPSLQGLEVVGWYCSHTRSELLLLDHELLLQESYFAGQNEFVIVFKPRDLHSVTIGIFSRNADRLIDPNRPSTILELPDIRALRNDSYGFVNGECNLPVDCSRPIPPSLKEYGSRLPRLLSALDRKRSDSLSEDRPAFGHSRRHESEKLPLSLAQKIGVVSAAVALIGVGAWKSVQLAGAHPPEVALSVRPYAGDFLVSWKSNLAKATRARVDIVDGPSSEHLNLTDIFQQSGVLLLPRNTGNIQATLTVDTANGAVVRRAAFSDSFGRVTTVANSGGVVNQAIVASPPPIAKRVQSRHPRHKHYTKRKRS